MIMKKSALFLVVLLLLSTYVIAEPADVDSAYSWLLSQPNTDVFTVSLTALAVSRADPSRTESYLEYLKPGQAKSQEFTINVDAGKISYGSCQDEYFFNLNSCLGSSILDKPSTIVEVSCQLLGSSQISVIYRESNTIYLISEPISTRGIFTI